MRSTEAPQVSSTKPRVSRSKLAKNSSSRAWWRFAPPGPVFKQRDGEIVCADALQFLNALSDSTADVVFLDPPFNLGKIYGPAGANADRLAEDKYSGYMAEVIRESRRVLKQGGSLYLYHIPRWALRLSRELDEGLQFRHWIAVSMKNGFARGSGLYPAHYALLHYSKGTPTVANRPKIPPATCNHCGEYIKDYGGYAQHVTDGVNLSDIWDDFSPVRHRKFKSRTANELPIGIPKRVLEISGSKGGVLVDPFAGSGTSLVAARLQRMKFIGNDREPDNCAVMQARLADLGKTKSSTTKAQK